MRVIGLRSQGEKHAFIGVIAEICRSIKLWSNWFSPQVEVGPSWKVLLHELGDSETMPPVDSEITIPELWFRNYLSEPGTTMEAAEKLKVLYFRNDFLNSL